MYNELMPSGKKKSTGYLIRSLKVFSIIAVICAVVVLVVLIALKFANTGKPANDVEKITDKVAKLMLLPDEKPTLATVVDREQLQKQGFFKDAQNEDVILIFPKSGKAVLYRPSVNKIIDVVPVRNVPPSPTTEPSASPTPEAAADTTIDESVIKNVDVVLLNGSTTPGITAGVMSKLTSQFDYVTVVDRQPAKSKAYETTLVIAITPTGDRVADDIASYLGAKVADLPKGESTYNADIIIIVGADKVSKS